VRETTTLAKDGELTPGRLPGGTFTLNNDGVFGVDGSTPIINHPEAAVLGIGRIMDMPWVLNGQVVTRKVTQLSLTFDHRECDGRWVPSAVRRLCGESGRRPRTQQYGLGRRNRLR